MICAGLQHAIWKSTSIDEALLEAMMSVFTKARMACKLQPLSQQDIENTSLDEVFQRKEVSSWHINFSEQLTSYNILYN